MNLNSLTTDFFDLKLSKFNALCTYLSNINTGDKKFKSFEDCFFVINRLFFFFNKATLKFSLRSINLFWTYYRSVHSMKFSNFYLNTISFYFQVFIDREQPRYVLLDLNAKLLNFFSTGFILKLYGIFSKCFRRMSERHSSVILFFLKFFKKKLLLSKGAFILTGYKRKYLYFINLIINKLVTTRFNSLYVFPRLKMNLYFFRRVKPIKKRIKKNMVLIQKSYH